MMKALAIGFALALTLGPVAAQAPSESERPSNPLTVSGEWDARWASAVRDEGDSVSVQRFADALLSLTVEGDSVRGHWHVPEFGGHTWVVRGRIAEGRLTMRAEETTQGPVPSDGAARLTLLEWTATVSGDGKRLEGSQWLTLDTPRGCLRSAPRPWSAVRRLEGKPDAAFALSPRPRLPSFVPDPDAARSVPDRPSVRQCR